MRRGINTAANPPVVDLAVNSTVCNQRITPYTGWDKSCRNTLRAERVLQITPTPEKTLAVFFNSSGIGAMPGKRVKILLKVTDNIMILVRIIIG